MGWINYIVVSKLKLLVPISRNVDTDGIINPAIDNLFNDVVKPIDIDTRLSDITIRDLSDLVHNHQILCDIGCIDSIDSLFMYWLNNKGIGYHVLHESKVDIENYKHLGYTILEWGNRL